MSFNNITPVERTQSQGKEIHKMLNSLCAAYRDGNMISVKRTVKETTKGPKETCSKTALVRAATKSRIELYLKDRNYSAALQQQNAIQKPTHFAGLNTYGPIADVANYFAQRLSPDKSHFYSDAAQFAFAAVLSGLVANSSDFVVDENNVNVAGQVKVLKGLVDYSVASSDQERELAIHWLYQHFVVGCFDRVTLTMREVMMNILVQAGSNVGYYNSAPQVRAAVQGKVLEVLAQVYGLSAELDKDGMFTSLPRDDWLQMKAAPKKKSDANHISLAELPAVARELKVLTEVVASLPAKYRVEQNHVTYYRGINVNPALAHRMWYVTGISVKSASIDSTPNTQIVEGGKRRTKLLSVEEAKQKLIKNIAKYFEAGSNGKKSNIELLYNKEKFLDITGANVSQATGLQIGAQTSSTIFLFPNLPLPAPASRDAFIADPATVFNFIKCCLGYPASKAAECDHAHVVEVIKDLHKIFGYPVPDVVQYNKVPAKGGSTNAFSSLSAPMMGFIQQPVYQQQFIQQAPPSLFGQAASTEGGEI